MKAFLPKRKKGYILMEVMLAAGIFAMAGIGLAAALNNIAKSYIEARKVSAIRMELASRLAEARIQRVSLDTVTEKETAEGITYQKEIAPMQFERVNRQGAQGSKIPMTGYFRITITAKWMEGKTPQDEKAEIYVYQP